MNRRSNVFTIIGIAALAGIAGAQSRHGGPVKGFRPLSTFGVSNGVAEIVTATADGRTLLYSNSSGGVIGFVDITNPQRPQIIAEVPVSGEPTSVSVAGSIAVAAVWVDRPSENQPPPNFDPGELVVMDVRDPHNPVVLGSVPIGWHPDSVKLVERRGGELVAVIAIENEPVVVENGLVTGETDPGSPDDVGPAGLVQIVTLNLRNVAASNVAEVRFRPAALLAAGLDYPSDPQPEFVSVHGTTAAISLQENNGIAIIDFADPRGPRLERVFTTGIVADRAADLSDDDTIDFGETYPADIDGVQHAIPTDAGGNPITPGTRNPDAIAFHPDGSVIFSADEGELAYTGGRGASAWTPTGRLAWDSAGEFEDIAVRFSHYPDGRSDAKGTEFEGVTLATFGERVFAFFGSERGSFATIYDVTRADRPRFVQILSTGISPEGAVAIPARGLFVTADEVSGTLSIFTATRTPYRPDADQPLLYSDGTPWAALSGLTASEFGPFLFGVPDNALPTQIYVVRVGSGFAPVRTLLDVTRDGLQARYDGEGIAVDTSILGGRFLRGFWIASEGDGRGQPNLLVQIDWRGRVLREIQLPNSIDAAADASLPGSAQGAAGGQRIRSNGFEGVSISRDGRYLYAAIQRDFTNEFPTGDRYTRIARYDLRQLLSATPPCSGLRCGGDWEFLYYRLDSNDGSNWAGLSEVITLPDGDLLVIERDKGIGNGSLLKKIYRVSVSGVQADADGVPDASDTVSKIEVRDVLDAFFPYEKIEGLAVTRDGDLWVGLDNDGGEVESRLVNTGRVVGRRR